MQAQLDGKMLASPRDDGLTGSPRLDEMSRAAR